VYRELAETYYKMARNKPSQAAANYKIALENYDKYMSFTDYSIQSRMRRADFLILIEDYAALEVEANKMIEWIKLILGSIVIWGTLLIKTVMSMLQ
jgi:hypothetical protein